MILPLIVNTVGRKAFNTGQKSLWMRFDTILSRVFSPSIRFMQSNILFIAAHFGAKKPNIVDFFFSFLNELRDIHDDGGLKIQHKVTSYNFMPLIFSCCCDLPAKGNGAFEMRTHRNLIATYDKIKASPINGIKGICCFIAAKNFDLIYSFAIDYMHLTLLDSQDFYIKKSSRLH